MSKENLEDVEFGLKRKKASIDVRAERDPNLPASSVEDEGASPPAFIPMKAFDKVILPPPNPAGSGDQCHSEAQQPKPQVEKKSPDNSASTSKKD